MTKPFKNFASMTDREYEKYRHGWLCPACGEPMVERKNSKTGDLFFGCSQFPNCTGTRNEDGLIYDRDTRTWVKDDEWEDDDPLLGP